MKKFFKQETVVCLSFCFVCFYGYSIWNRNVQNVLWNWKFLEGFVNKIWTAIQRQTNMFHCTSNTCIRKNSGTYLFDEVTTWAKGKHRRCDFANGVLNSCVLTVPASTLHNLLVTALYISWISGWNNGDYCRNRTFPLPHREIILSAPVKVFSHPECVALLHRRKICFQSVWRTFCWHNPDS